MAAELLSEQPTKAVKVQQRMSLGRQDPVACRCILHMDLMVGSLA